MQYRIYDMGILDNSYPWQLMLKTTRNQENSNSRQLTLRTTRTQKNSYLRKLVPRATRTSPVGQIKTSEKMVHMWCWHHFMNKIPLTACFQWWDDLYPAFHGNMTRRRNMDETTRTQQAWTTRRESKQGRDNWYPSGPGTTLSKQIGTK